MGFQGIGMEWPILATEATNVSLKIVGSSAHHLDFWAITIVLRNHGTFNAFLASFFNFWWWSDPYIKKEGCEDTQEVLKGSEFETINVQFNIWDAFLLPALLKDFVVLPPDTYTLCPSSVLLFRMVAICLLRVAAPLASVATRWDSGRRRWISLPACWLAWSRSSVCLLHLRSTGVGGHLSLLAS